jgi:hypothetical protein
MDQQNVKVNNTLTNAVSSCGLEISLATIVDGFNCLMDGVGVLSLSFSPILDGVGLTFNGNANEGICSWTLYTKYRGNFQGRSM